MDGTPTDAAPRAMFYFGWYSYNLYYDIYDWLPGKNLKVFVADKSNFLGSYASDLDSVNFGYDYRNNYYPVFGTQSLYHGGQ